MEIRNKIIQQRTPPLKKEGLSFNTPQLNNLKKIVEKIVEKQKPKSIVIQPKPQIVVDIISKKDSPPNNVIQNNIKIESPHFYILTRTNSRPHGFDRCVNSLLSQTYTNFTHIVSIDNKETWEYVKKYPHVLAVEIDKNEIEKETDIPSPQTGGKFIYNKYLNKLMEYVKDDSWVIILDDDDYFNSSDVLKKISDQLTSYTDLVLWSMQKDKNTLIPNKLYMGKTPKLGQIGSPCVAVSTNIAKTIKFDGWKCGDFRYIEAAFKKSSSKKWIFEPLVQMGGVGGGKKIDIPSVDSRPVGNSKKITEKDFFFRDGRMHQILHTFSQPYFTTNNIDEYTSTDTKKVVYLSVGWNCEQYVKDWYNSLLNQTNKNWIAYVLDDASNDKTFDHLIQIASKDTRIFVYKNITNMGAAFSRMRLLEEMKLNGHVSPTDIIAMLDLDDMIPNYVTRELLKAYDNDSVKMSFSSYENQYGKKYPLDFYNKLEINDKMILRAEKFKCSPLRTFRFDTITNLTYDDMKNSQKSYYITCTDVILTLQIMKNIKYENIHLFDQSMYIHRENRSDSSIKKFGGITKKEIFKKILKQVYG